MKQIVPCDVSVITVTYNSGEYIIDQLKSVRDTAGDLMVQQLVIDNGSKDDTVAKAMSVSGVDVIANNVNLGFAAANNLGLEQATGTYVLFLNPDMVVKPGALQTLVDYLKTHEKVAIAAPLLVDQSGNIAELGKPRRFPTFFDQFMILSKLAKLFPSSLHKYLMHDIDVYNTQMVDSVRGAAMMVRASFLQECGFAFDPRYFIWFEDVDLCKEAVSRGYGVHHVAQAHMVDYIGKSFSFQDTYWKQQQFSKSMLIYFQKWGSVVEALALGMVRAVVLVAVKGVEMMKKVI